MLFRRIQRHLHSDANSIISLEIRDGHCQGWALGKRNLRKLSGGKSYIRAEGDEPIKARHEPSPGLQFHPLHHLIQERHNDIQPHRTTKGRPQNKNTPGTSRCPHLHFTSPTLLLIHDDLLRHTLPDLTIELDGMGTREADLLGQVVRQEVEQSGVPVRVEERFVGEFGVLVRRARGGLRGRGGGLVGDGEVEVES